MCPGRDPRPRSCRGNSRYLGRRAIACSPVETKTVRGTHPNKVHPVFAYFGASWGLCPQSPGICRFGPTSDAFLTEAPFARLQEAVQGGIAATVPANVLALPTARILPREGRFMGRNPWKTAPRRLFGRTLNPQDRRRRTDDGAVLCPRSSVLALAAFFTSSSAGVRFLFFRTRRIATPDRQRWCWRRFQGTRETSRPSP